MIRVMLLLVWEICSNRGIWQLRVCLDLPRQLEAHCAIEGRRGMVETTVSWRWSKHKGIRRWEEAPRRMMQPWRGKDEVQVLFATANHTRETSTCTAAHPRSSFAKPVSSSSATQSRGILSTRATPSSPERRKVLHIFAIPSLVSKSRGRFPGQYL